MDLPRLVLLQRFPGPAPQPEDLFNGDVGQDSFWDVDFQPATSAGGENYGWRLTEATHCFNPASNFIDGSSLTLPVIEYSHAAGGCSIFGGYGIAEPPRRTSLVSIFMRIAAPGRYGATETSPGVFSSELIVNTGLSITAFGED